MDNQLIEELKGLDHYEPQTAKLSRKLRENPFVGIGILGLLATCTVGGLRFNKRALSVPASLYLMQLRVAAQGSVVGSLAVGLAYTVYQNGGQWPSAEAQAESHPSRESKQLYNSYKIWH